MYPYPFKFTIYFYVRYFIVILPFFAGVAQGIITGIRGLCNGLGPALFGFIFYLFHVDLNENSDSHSDVQSSENNTYHQISSAIQVIIFQLDFMFWSIYFYLSSRPFYHNILLGGILLTFDKSGDKRQL